MYVWPHVNELSKKLCELPLGHLDVMRRFLANYSGFCNFNYKVRNDGKLCIFEANARVGGDLAFDIPQQWPDLAQAMFEKLDEVGGPVWPPELEAFLQQ